MASQFSQQREFNSELSEYESNVMNFDRRYVLCIQKLCHRLHFTVVGSWNKSLQLQPLQRCYCENSGSPASSYVMRRYHSNKCTQSRQAIIGLLPVGRVRNLLCGHPLYNVLFNYSVIFKIPFKTKF